MAQKRFIRRGVAVFYFVPTVAADDYQPTRAELDAGDNITEWIAGVNGFQVTATTIPAPDMSSRFDKTIPGNTSVADSSLRLYDDLDTDEIETLFPYGTEGVLVIFHKGEAPGKPGLAYPVRVSSRAPNLTVDMQPADNTVSFTITGEPNLDTITVPEAA